MVQISLSLGSEQPPGRFDSKNKRAAGAKQEQALSFGSPHQEPLDLQQVIRPVQTFTSQWVTWPATWLPQEGERSAAASQSMGRVPEPGRNSGPQAHMWIPSGCRKMSAPHTGHTLLGPLNVHCPSLVFQDTCLVFSELSKTTEDKEKWNNLPPVHHCQKERPRREKIWDRHPMPERIITDSLEPLWRKVRYTDSISQTKN